MSKKLRRVFRDQPVTADEAAADQIARNKLVQEFPPKAASSTDKSRSLSDLLRRSIQESQCSVEEIAHIAGVSPTIISAFISGERDIHMATADKLARALDLEVSVE